MGMPGSKTALEELMSRVLGDLLKEGIVTKIVDDLYCGRNSPGELLLNLKKVLQAPRKWGLRLSASKTSDNPQSTMIPSWISNSGSLSASPHHITTLASCPEPGTVAREWGHSSELSRCSPASSLDALHYSQTLTTLSLAVNLNRRCSGQMTFMRHSTRLMHPFPPLKPSRSPFRVINWRL